MKGREREESGKRAVLTQLECTEKREEVKERRRGEGGTQSGGKVAPRKEVCRLALDLVLFLRRYINSI